MKQGTIKNSIGRIITIAIIIAVVIVGVKYTKDFLAKENVKDVQADLLLVKAKVETLKGKYSMNKEENPLKGYQLTQLPENIDITEFKEKNVISEEEYEKYYLLDSRKFGANGFERIS